ncbi:esterase-like activity of phytase family protein [Nitrosomonas ureae]|uniref:Phytase-like protein with esterase activity n=1 Tax=Nitrosomonas ureae TaxID=44577 RepID=A0A2T5IXF2_9PROT|nr:esterase-like activity of phytase family protein [Nitrosomonas ureae]PTQ88619.1 phytase-like protein with esterase activity [Nitrosomonas ureae]
MNFSKNVFRFTKSALSLALIAVLPSLVFAESKKSSTPHFQRIATYLVCENTSCDRDIVNETVAEIVAASKDGNTLIYTDSPTGRIGFVDIHDAENPVSLGTLHTDGEPTSVSISGDYALVGVNTSASFLEPSGILAVYHVPSCLSNVSSCSAIREINMGGQPDSVAISPDGRYAAVVIENERDEDITVSGVEGGLPQPPAGYLNIIDLAGTPANWDVRQVDLTGLAVYGSDDPEPEFVTINQHNIAAVTMQENNHIVFVNLVNGTVLKHFTAGTVTLDGIDSADNKLIDFTDTLTDVAREPDGIAWLGNNKIVTANEGDLFGGSRGFSMFNRHGKVLYDSGTEFEYLAAAAGHYPEKRSDNKGTEPEGITTGRYKNETFVFVGSERGNFVGVYKADGNKLKYRQMLPTGAGPEGLLAIPSRKLFVASTEVDSPVRSQINIFRLEHKPAAYPQIQSVRQADGKPIVWGALSALSSDRYDTDRLYAVHDSFYNESRIYSIDISDRPAKITSATPLLKDGVSVNYDLEGIAQRSNGSFWLVSEGAGTSTTHNLLIEARSDGTVVREIRLPGAVEALQQSNGFEGVAVTGKVGASEQVYVAFQREWKNDPAGMARIGQYTPALDLDPAVDEGEWKFFYYPLDAVESPAGGFVGLSEITTLGHNKFAIIERDNQSGPNARIKRVYRIDINGVIPKTQAEGDFPILSKTLAIDVLPAMQAGKGWVHDKLEGLAKTVDGTVYVVTDNDGVDNSTGETQFLNLGKALN